MQRVLDKQRRFRRIGFLIGALMVAVWCATLFCDVAYERRRGAFLLGSGNVGFWIWGADQASFVQSRWVVEPHGFHHRWLPYGRMEGDSIMLLIPMWMLLLAVAIPMVVVPWRNQRPPRGYCSFCGYNLTGNTSGVCPECGKPTTTENHGNDSCENGNGG